MRLFHKDNKAAYRISIAIGLVLGFFLFIGIHNYLHWHGRDYFGEITQISGNRFVLAETHGHAYTVDMNNATRVRRGIRSFQNGLNVGDRVIVVGSETADGHIEAVLIRVTSSVNRPSGATTTATTTPQH